MELPGIAGDLLGTAVNTADCIVVGAGIIGGSIVWRLARGGLRVILLDAGRMGPSKMGAASWAAAGMLAPGGEIDSASPWASFALENLRAYPGFVAELEAETGESLDFQRHGALEIAMTEADWAPLLRRAACQEKLGIRALRISGEEALRQVPLLAPAVAGALFYPEDALVDPRGILRALRAACLARGVEIREGVPVREVRPGRDTVEVVTGDGILSAGAAVLAAGAWSSGIRVAGCELPRTFPVRGHLAGFALDAGSIGPILRCGHTYVLQRAAGFTVVGTSSEQCGFNHQLDKAIVSRIHERAAALVPAFAGRAFTESWLGFRPGVDGEGPIVRPVAGTTLWLAYGHYRNGILMAPLTAARVADGIRSLA
ncbi:MAG TPA: FAD-dependent oxidoreductase [Bryobacteraceae bacterium]|nr:FAD-dependent oxidoreductase [Bryobacteraceae bacterium]